MVPDCHGAMKQRLRTQLKAMRRGLGPSLRAEADAAVARRVRELPEWGRAGVVLAYLSVRDEVDTRTLVGDAWEAGKVVAAPRVTGPRELAWYRVEPGDALETSRLGIEEPVARSDRLVDVVGLAPDALALVPALAFDEKGYRLGYGGGFYDAFLARFPGVSVGLAREAALVPSLGALGALEPHDRPVDLVVSESRTIGARRQRPSSSVSRREGILGQRGRENPC